MEDPIAENLYDLENWNPTPLQEQSFEHSEQHPPPELLDDELDFQHFVSTSSKSNPYGHGLFITFPQTNVNLDKAKEVFIKVDFQIKQLNKHLHDAQGGCCVQNHNTTSGTHIHIVINYPKQERFYLTQQLRTLLTQTIKQGNYQVLKNYQAACTYIKRDGNVWFNYEIEEQEVSRKNHRKFQNKDIIDKLISGNLLPYTDGSIAPQNLKSTIQGIQMLRNLTPPKWDLGQKEIWFIYGKSRTGKSSYARQVIADNNFFIKQSNTKWFDGYQGQDCIILEDLPKYTSYMLYHLKMWLDTVHQTVEIKGAAIWLNCRKIVITSNHSLYDCLASVDHNGNVTMDNDDYEAVEARIHHIWRATNRNFDWRIVSTFEFEQIK